MSENIIQQEALFRIVNRALANFKKYGQPNYTAPKIRARIASLKETWNKCIVGHAALLSTYSKEQRATIDYFKADKLEEHEDHYQIALDLMQEWLEQLEPPVSPTQSRSIDNSFSRTETALSLNHLPPIKLPPFADNFAEWESFRDRFTALIIENKDLSDFSRMHFLASSLTGAAREVISSIAITADNFPVAWKALKARFENKNRLIDLHVAALYNLPSMSRESAAELHALRDTTDRSIEALKCLGRSKEQILSDILVYFVARKLDPSTRRAWKLKSSTESDPLSYEKLTKFLSSRATALDELTPLNSKPARNVKANNATASDTSAPTCSLCKKQHYFSKCAQFVNKSPSKKREIVKQSKWCFNCLSLKHSVQECTSKFSCRTCKKRHHSSLHLDSNSDSASTASSANTVDNITANETANQPATTTLPSHAVTLSSISGKASPSPVLLATARVIIEAPNGRRIAVRALLDQGSEVTFIKENIVQTLRLRRTRTLTTISAVGCADIGTCRNTTVIKISPRDKFAPTFSTVAFILSSLTKYHPRPMQSVDDWEHLRDLQLADDDPTGSAPIELILGADLYSRLILDGIRKGSDGNPIAQNSHLGWIISGPVSANFTSSHTVNVFHCSLETEIKRFWEIEEPPSERILSPDEQQCEEHFRLTHSRSSDGRYTVRLPFKRGPPIEIGESRTNALRQLTSLKRRLDSNLKLKKEYVDFLREYETLGHMKQVDPPTSADTQVVYIPHHAVIRESSSTTKVRVVFNASSLTSNNTSLNSHLHIGPKLQTDLTAILLRWRQYKYVYSADIAKMYRQIYIDNRDRNYQRILWYDVESNEIRDYQLFTVTYGTASAPYLALRTIQQLLLDDGNQYPLTIPILQDNIYVDDVLFGAEDIPLIRRSREQVCDLLANGGFTLRKWASNKAELLQDISSEDYGLACNNNFQLDDSLNILGIVWNPALDSFQYQVSLSKSVPTTKRTILSAIAKLFDPLGWVTPITVTAKIFMQNMWHLKLDWDDPVPSSILTRWKNIYHNLSHLNGLKVPRWTGRGSDTLRCELHGFADASTVAYAAAVYIRDLNIK